MAREQGGSVGLPIYRLLAVAATPFLAIHLQSRVRSGREDPIRWVERWGYTEEARPEAPLIWFHAVSVGECAVALPILGRCLKVSTQPREPVWHFTNRGTTLGQVATM